MKKYNQFNILLFSIAIYLCAVASAHAQSICFSPPTQHFITTGSGIYGAVADDFNNDGLIDLVTSNSTSNNISIMLGDGNGSFAPSVNYATGTTASGRKFSVHLFMEHFPCSNHRHGCSINSRKLCCSCNGCQRMHPNRFCDCH